MKWVDIFQVLAVVLAFVATGASQFLEVRKKATEGNSWWKGLTKSGKWLAGIFAVSLLFAIVTTVSTIRDTHRNTNTLSTIVDSLQNERRLEKRYDSARLRSSIEWLGQCYINIWLYPSLDHISEQDSIVFRNRLLDFTNTVLSELKSLSGNIELYENRNLDAFLISVREVVSREKLTLYGYDFTSLKKVNKVLQLVGTKLREMSENYTQEIYYQKEKIDTNLYPILKSVADSAWVDK